MQRSCTSSIKKERIKKEGKQSTTRCGTSSKAKLYARATPVNQRAYTTNTMSACQTSHACSSQFTSQIASSVGACGTCLPSMMLANHIMLTSRSAVHLLSMSIAARQPEQADPHQLHLVRSTGGPCQAAGELCEIGQFDGPRHIAPLPGGGACVVDGLNHRVQLLDAEGEAVGTIDGLRCPTGVAVHDDRLFISESTGAHRVTCRRLSDGALIGSVGGLGSGDGELHGAALAVLAHFHGDVVYTASYEGTAGYAEGRPLRNVLGPGGDPYILELLGVTWEEVQSSSRR